MTWTLFNKVADFCNRNLLDATWHECGADARIYRVDYAWETGVRDCMYLYEDCNRQLCNASRFKTAQDHLNAEVPA